MFRVTSLILKENMPKVNLDALIKREDLAAPPQDDQMRGGELTTIRVHDFAPDSLIFPRLRKPDFQRETSEWSQEKICGLIESFVNNDLIPAVIMWQAKGTNTFVIDGSHRLSALAAWVNDDYGDKFISQPFFGGSIPLQQKKFARETRELVNERVGEYRSYLDALKNPNNYPAEFGAKARNLPFYEIPVQWCKFTDPKRAEAAFLKINKEPVYITNTELKLIESRNKPNAISARAIISGGVGHQYWHKFPQEKQAELKILAEKLKTFLFEPTINEPIKTTDLPIGGKPYGAQTLPLVFDFVNIVNNVDMSPDRKGKAKNHKSNEESVKDAMSIGDDLTGEETIKFLKNCARIADRIHGNDPSSLGLHPYVYFWSRTGKHKPASFYAVVALIMDMEKRDAFKKFLTARRTFEEFLLQQDDLVQQMVRKYRSIKNGFLHIKDFFNAVLGLIGGGTAQASLVSKIIEDKRFQFLRTEKIVEQTTRQEFSRAKKSFVYLRQEGLSISKCPYCNGFLSPRSKSIDHIISEEEGGMGEAKNAQAIHHYCNSIKEGSKKKAI